MKTDDIYAMIPLAQLNELLQKIQDLEFMVSKLNEELQKKVDVEKTECHSGGA